MQVGYSAVIIYVPAVCLAKVAILIFYLRLNPTKYFRISVYVILGIVWSYMIALALALIFQCNPIRKAWDPLVAGTCIPNAKLYMANSTLNVITDFLVLLVPIPMILKLHTSSRQKWIIAGLFTLGSLYAGRDSPSATTTRANFDPRTSVLSAIRTYYIHELVASPDDANWRVTTSSTLVYVSPLPVPSMPL